MNSDQHISYYVSNNFRASEILEILGKEHRREIILTPKNFSSTCKKNNTIFNNCLSKEVGAVTEKLRKACVLD